MQSRLALGFSQPEKDERAAIQAAWAPILKRLPTEILQESYEIAMEMHRDGPFGVFEVIGGYDELLKRREAAYKQVQAERERKERARKDGDVPMPPEIKKMMAISYQIWDLNAKARARSIPAIEKSELLEQIASLKKEWTSLYAGFNSVPSACASCQGSGWARIFRTDPVSGLPGEATRPCECGEGDKYRRSYQLAISSV